jgi:hypothetical protein
MGSLCVFIYKNWPNIFNQSICKKTKIYIQLSLIVT